MGNAETPRDVAAAGDPAARSAQPEPTAPGSEGDLYVVATVHLDTQWRWTIQRTIREYLPDTFNGNFALFEKYPHYVLSWEGAFRYMLIQEYYPEAWERLAEYARAGRWAVAGNMLESVDVNLISPESLVRQFLYGSRFFERELGSDSTDVFLPDCFGFGFSFPSIAAHCGRTGFSSQKFIKWMKPAKTPFDVGVWEGPDGASLLAVLNPEGYGDGVVEDLSRAQRWRDRIGALGRETGCYAEYKYFGIGDRGGAPDEASLEWLDRSLRDPGPLRIVHDRSDRFFRDIAEYEDRLPRHRGELLLPEHGPGCYTSLASMKRWNRKNEQLADAAERMAAAADWSGALPYPGKAIEESWVRFLWHQMHDDLTGTSIPDAYRFSWNDEAIATNRFSATLQDSVGALAGLLDTDVEGVPLVVVNPLSIERRDLVEAVIRFEQAPPAAVRVFDSEGRELPSQCSEPRGSEMRVAFVAEAPPVGCAVVDVRPSDAPSRLPSALSVSTGGLESDRYRVQIDANGDVSSVYDKLLGRELLAGPLGLELLPDWSSKFPAWEMRYDDVSAPPERMQRLLGCRVAERGPARVSLELRRALRGSTLTQRLSLTDGGERLEIANRLEWRTWGKMLKASFPLAFEPEQATYDAGLGVIERGVNRRELYEVPAQQWADLSAEDGVSILNDCKYGWDRPDRRTLRLTLVRSPWAARGHPHQATQDWGSHRFTYALYGHPGDWRRGTAPQAARLNQPLLAFQAPARKRSRRRSFSFARVASDDLAIQAIKRAEDGDEWIVRLREISGRDRPEVELEMAAPITSAREVDGLEREIGAARVREGKLVLDVGAFAPRSFALRLAPPVERLSKPTSEPVALPVDTAVVSFDGDRGGPDFDGRGNSIPGELLPATIVCGGVGLELGSLEAGRLGCLACRGQSIELPRGDWQRAFLLAAAVGGNATGVFGVGDRTFEVEIADYRSLIGQASHRPAIDRVRYGSPRKAFQRWDRIAWIGTHLHDRAGENLPYEFCYLFRYALPMPGAGDAAGSVRITLPREPRIRLFGLSVARDLHDELRRASPR